MIVIVLIVPVDVTHVTVYANEGIAHPHTNFVQRWLFNDVIFLKQERGEAGSVRVCFYLRNIRTDGRTDGRTGVRPCGEYQYVV